MAILISTNTNYAGIYNGGSLTISGSVSYPTTSNTLTIGRSYSTDPKSYIRITPSAIDAYTSTGGSSTLQFYNNSTNYNVYFGNTTGNYAKVSNNGNFYPKLITGGAVSFGAVATTNTSQYYPVFVTSVNTYTQLPYTLTSNVKISYKTLYMSYSQYTAIPASISLSASTQGVASIGGGGTATYKLVHIIASTASPKMYFVRARCISPINGYSSIGIILGTNSNITYTWGTSTNDSNYTYNRAELYSGTYGDKLLFIQALVPAGRSLYVYTYGSLSLYYYSCSISISYSYYANS